VEVVLASLNEQIEAGTSAAVCGDQANASICINLKVLVDVDLFSQLGAEEDDPDPSFVLKCGFR
jgi:hypothetical protein